MSQKGGTPEKQHKGVPIFELDSDYFLQFFDGSEDGSQAPEFIDADEEDADIEYLQGIENWDDQLRLF